MNSLHIVFAPLLGWAALAALAAFCALACGAAFWRRARGAWLRAAGFVVLFGILAGPLLVRETSRPLPDFLAVAMDQSASMAIGRRAAMARAALQDLQTKAANIPGLQLRVVDVPAADDGGTALFAALRDALDDVPAAQRAGVAAITDGEISDPPAAPLFGVPFTALLTAKAEETDRELRLLAAPSYGLVGKTVSLRLEVFDHGVGDAGSFANVTVTEDGAPVWTGRRDAVVGGSIGGE
jgi:hypothetical protein